MPPVIQPGKKNIWPVGRLPGVPRIAKAPA